MDKDERYQQILQQAQDDPGVLGFALTAGRGKGFSTEHSDYDVYIIVSDDKLEVAKEKYRSGDMVDIFLHTLSSFRDYAKWGSSFEWDRYNFTCVKAQIDKTGEIQKIIDEKGVIPADKIAEASEFNLGAYINYYYRSLKNHRDGNTFAAYLDSSESIIWLIAFVFSIEGRVKPYNKYLEWALEKYPLHFLPWSPKEFIEIIEEILQTGDINLQADVFRKVCKLAVDRGYKESIKEWDGCRLDEI